MLNRLPPSIRLRRWLLYCLLALLTVCGCIGLSWGHTLAATRPIAGAGAPLHASATIAQAADPGRDLYESGRYRDAVPVLQQEIERYAAEGDRLRQALTLSNLSLVYQQLGEWDAAQQAIAQSIELASKLPRSEAQQQVIAQALDIQGRLEFSIGNAEAALAHWQSAAEVYDQLGDRASSIASQLSQTQALQALGLYRRAIDQLQTLDQQVQDHPLQVQMVVLRSLADALMVAGDLGLAQERLERSLAIATELNETEDIAAAYLSLGNLTRAQAIAQLTLENMTIEDAIDQLNTPPRTDLSPIELAVQRQRIETAQTFYTQTQTALDQYQQAITLTTRDATRIRAHLNQLNLMASTQRWTLAQPLIGQLQTELEQQPPSRDRFYDQIDLAQSLIQFEQVSSANQVALDAAQLLASVEQQAKALGDRRSQSYALGSLGRLYETHQRWDEAKSLTAEALSLSQAINAADISYRWQWQLGRLLRVERDNEGAIAAYSQAVETLKSLRNDLVSINRDVQFSFRESVEPVYRELVDLLLKPDTVSQTDLESLVQARNVIEGLQIAELDNFFREACLDTAFELDRVVDQANLSAGIFYTILLPNRLEVILKLPQRNLIHYTTFVPQSVVEDTATNLLNELKKPFVSTVMQTQAEQLYDWLIRPVLPYLEDAQPNTLVFVLDGVLRNVPMSVLHDGDRYLVESYNLAVAPGLQLPDPKPLQQRQFRALVAGLSEARNNFPPLTYVAEEVEEIQSSVPSQVIFNENFTKENFASALESAPFSIVHVATHGQFSSNAEETFILAWDDPINVNELSRLLQAQEISSPEPIELLILSACRTAAGDKRAALGLAGVAVRAGARSTIASLWSLDDDSGALLMRRFYEELTQNPITKADALRRAQLRLLENPQYAAPRFWAPYVLLGNWL